MQASPSVACPRDMVMLSQFPVWTHFHPLFLTAVALSVAHQSPGVCLKCEFSSLWKLFAMCCIFLFSTLHTFQFSIPLFPSFLFTVLLSAISAFLLCFTPRRCFNYVLRYRSWCSILLKCALTPETFQNKWALPVGSVHLGICEHSGRTLMRNKTIDPRSPHRGVFGSIPFRSWSVKWKQSQPHKQNKKKLKKSYPRYILLDKRCPKIVF